MNKKWIKRIFIAVAILLLSITSLIGIFAFNIWHENNYKAHLQTLKVDNKNIQFVLFTDISGFGDRAWYVYQLPADGEISKGMRTGHDTRGVIFWNYSEAGYHYENPKIEIQSNKFLVFSRGGLYHSLYNIETKEVLVNEESPWGAFLSGLESKNSANKQPNREEEKLQMNSWVKKNLHFKIVRILQKAT